MAWHGRWMGVPARFGVCTCICNSSKSSAQFWQINFRLPEWIHNLPPHRFRFLSHFVIVAVAAAMYRKHFLFIIFHIGFAARMLAFVYISYFIAHIITLNKFEFFYRLTKHFPFPFQPCIYLVQTIDLNLCPCECVYGCVCAPLIMNLFRFTVNEEKEKETHRERMESEWATCSESNSQDFHPSFDYIIGGHLPFVWRAL